MPTDPGWAVARLGAESMWRRGVLGEGVVVGHLDSGVDDRHPAMRGRIDAFAHVDRRGALLADHEPSDDLGHGTRTASLICGGSVDGFPIGAAPGARLASAAAIEHGDVVVRILAGLDWIARQDVKVLCLALGRADGCPVFERAVARLAARDVLVIAPTGNGGPGVVHSPASHPTVLSVGALDDRGDVAGFTGSRSSTTDGSAPIATGSAPDVYAPGVDVLVAAGTGLSTGSGTSLACALASGAAALLAAEHPHASAADLRQALSAGAGAVPGETGGGAVDVVRSSALLRGARPARPTTDAPDHRRRHHDPLLDELLDGHGDGRIETAVIVLSACADRDAWRGRVRQLVNRCAAQTCIQPADVVAYDSIETLVVRGAPRLLRLLVSQPEVAVTSAGHLRTAWRR